MRENIKGTNYYYILLYALCKFLPEKIVECQSSGQEVHFLRPEVHHLQVVEGVVQLVVGGLDARPRHIGGPQVHDVGLVVQDALQEKRRSDISNFKKVSSNNYDGSRFS